MKIIIALGGNAILRKGDRGTAEEQLRAAKVTASTIIRMTRPGDHILITHGNGPQVGDILLKNEFAKKLAPPMPLDICGAESQGMIGYMLEIALAGELSRRGVRPSVAVVLTNAVVLRDDPSFQHPSKPVGPFYPAREAAALKSKGWSLVFERGKGYRRVVPSPRPIGILEKDTIASLFESGCTVVAGGGGGIPVVRTADGGYEGVQGVVDKDRTSALLGATVGAEILLILTDVDCAYLDFGTPRQRQIRRAKASEMERHLADGQFPPGSMGPKVESAVSFVKSGGRRAIITSLELAEKAMKGSAGTTVLP